MEPDLALTPYQRIGGAPKVRELVDRFYRLMDALPEAQGIRSMHGEDLSGSRERLFDFLSGWLGGPQLFMEKHGHPMLRRRHLDFSIGPAERDQWLLCIRRALEDAVEDAALRVELYAAFAKVADFVRNREN